MRRTHAKLSPILALGAGFTLALPAQAVEYDGNWQFALSCAANGAQPAFTERFTAPIAQNAVSRTRSNRTAQGTDDISRFTGRIEADQMTAVLDRIRGTDRWSVRFAGPATSERRFDLTGGMFVGDRQVRSCQLVAEALTSAPGSLVATAPARAEGARQQLAASQAASQAAQQAAHQAALASLEARGEAEAQSLRTDLDLARFEGAAMRAELTQRSAMAAALETRLRAAEAAIAQAQAAQARTVAMATADIGQRDQRLVEAATQRAALEARITAVEAATATQRAALETRIAAAHAAATQAQAAAATERTALQARITAAEAATTQLRMALETAQRELTEARAAQPPR